MAAILKKIEKLYESKLCREWSRLDEIRQADAKSYGKKTANIIVKKNLTVCNFAFSMCYFDYATILAQQLLLSNHIVVRD